MTIRLATIPVIYMALVGKKDTNKDYDLYDGRYKLRYNAPVLLRPETPYGRPMHQ